MSTNNPFGFDPNKLTEMLGQTDFSKFFDVKSFDGDALVEAQKKNMAALVEANKIAAVQYQEIFKAQLDGFQENLAKAQSQMSDVKAPKPGDVEAQAELLRKSVEETTVQMQELAEKAKSANGDAYAIIAERVQEAMTELQTMADKLKG